MDDVLDRAILVFRQQGYHATSVDDLARAMRLTPGSLYKAFKDKRAIFLAALDRYATLRSRQIRQIAATNKTGRERLCDVLTAYVQTSQGDEGRSGCLVVGSAVELAILDPEIALRVRGSLRKNGAFLASLIEAGRLDGSIAAHIDSEATSQLLVCLTQGLRVVGKTGGTRLDAAAAVAIAMKWLD